MEVKNSTTNEPRDILQAYRLASDVAGSSEDCDTKIGAYNKVINFCSGNESCRLDRSVKKNTLLYWAYNNVASAYVQKRQFAEALENYQKSLLFAVDSLERVTVLNHLAEIYMEIKDRHNWFMVKGKIIDDLPFAERRTAYLELIAQASDNNVVAEILERALQMVTKEEIPVSLKCEHVLSICKRLQGIYSQNNNLNALQRVEDLYKKTTALASKAVSKKL